MADGEFVERFFISTPDFEFGNPELGEMLWRLANRKKRESNRASADDEPDVEMSITSDPMAAVNLPRCLQRIVSVERHRWLYDG